MDLQLILESAELVGSLKPDGFDGNPDGYDTAIVGITDNGQLVYSKEKMVELLMEVSDMNEDEAWDYMYFNCFGAYVGEMTPIFINEF